MEDTLKTLDLLLVNNQLPIHRSIFSLIFIHKFDYLSVPSIRKNVIDLIKTEIVTINDDIAQIRRIYGYLKVFFKRIPEIREFLIQVIDFQLKSGTEVFTDIFLHLLFTFNNINYFYKEFPELRQRLSNLVIKKLNTNDQFFSKETFKSIKQWPLLDEDTYLRDKYFLQRILEYWSLTNLIKYAPDIIPIVSEKLADYLSILFDRKDFWIPNSLTKHWPLDLLLQKLPQIKPFLIKCLNEDLMKAKDTRYTLFRNIVKDKRVNNSFIKEYILHNTVDVQKKILDVFKSQKIIAFTRNKELTEIVKSLTGSTHPKIQKLTLEILSEYNQDLVINKIK